VSYLNRGIVRMNIATTVLDVAKNVFQVHGVGIDGAPVIRRKLRRGSVLPFFGSVPPCLVGSRRVRARTTGPAGSQGSATTSRSSRRSMSVLM
jgi:hypothetical protein